MKKIINNYQKVRFYVNIYHFLYMSFIQLILILADYRGTLLNLLLYLVFLLKNVIFLQIFFQIQSFNEFIFNFMLLLIIIIITIIIIINNLYFVIFFPLFIKYVNYFHLTLF
jgi:hypothetical protein